MERLTYDFVIGNRHCWQVKGADNLLCEEICKTQGDNGCVKCPIAKAFDRLAAYEDTGLEPEEIFKATATDMSSVVHGHWKEGTVRGSFALICSECGCDTGVNYDFAYCPNCGAKMDLLEEVIQLDTRDTDIKMAEEYEQEAEKWEVKGR